MYLNGAAVALNHNTISGNLSNWDDSYRLALADEFDSSNGRSWAGAYYLAAIYGRALTAAEVSQNYNAGPNQTAPTPTPTNTPAPTATPQPAANKFRHLWFYATLLP